MNYTFKEAEKELGDLFDKLIAEAKTDKEKYILKCVWETYKRDKIREDEDELNTTYERGYEDGRDSMRAQYED